MYVCEKRGNSGVGIQTIVTLRIKRIGCHFIISVESEYCGVGEAGYVFVRMRV